MIWNCIKIISFAVLIVSCSNKKNSNYTDKLTANEIISNWKNSIKEKGEPPYLGGMYVESGFVCFCITHDTYKIRNDILKRCKSSNGIIIKMCRNSKESLMQQIKILDSLLLKKGFTNLKYYGHYLDEKKNKIVIMLGDTSTSNIALFKESVMDSPTLIFEKSEEIFFE